MNAKKGFTLIEIMIVVAIIAILAAVAIPNFISYRKTAQKNSCLSTKDTIATAVEAYMVANPSFNGTSISLSEKILWNDKGTGFLKTTTEPLCPDGSSKYTIAIDATTRAVTVTCGHTEEDSTYAHNPVTETPTPTPGS